MSLSDIIKKVNDLVGDVNFLPYNIKEVEVFCGLPPVPITGLEYIWADYLNPQSRFVPSLTGKGVFLNNINQSGIIEFALLDGVVSGAAIQLMDLTGIPLPIAATDLTTGGTSTVIGSKCKLVKTPAWRRKRLTGLSIYTFEVERLFTSTGVRFSE